ncbi:glycosyltransferase family 4 protein [Chitinophaga sp. Cy-1792]|nr:glycosyltransferase family 4 protein [Chitinophaga sp. Cy-1792]
MHSNRKIRVLQTIHQGRVGGGERHVLDLVSTIDTSRFEPIVLSFTEGPMVDTLRMMQIPVFVIATERPFDFRVWGAVKKLLKEQRIDMVHVHGSRANTNILWIARSMGLPVIYTVHGWSFHNELPFWNRKARIFAERLITRRTGINITVSESNRQTGMQVIQGFRSVVIRNGVNLNSFTPDIDGGHVRESYGFKATDIVVGFIVRMTIQKDPLGMVRAFAAAHAIQPALKLLMVGEGPLKSEVMELAARLGLDHAVVFDDFRQDIPRILKAIDIYCLPSLWEGFPIGVLEAMAMGKAIIASDVDGTREALEDNVSGILIPPRNTAVLSATLLKLANDPALRCRLANAALQRARAEHSITAMTTKIEEVYSNVFYKLVSH